MPANTCHTRASPRSKVDDLFLADAVERSRPRDHGAVRRYRLAQPEPCIVIPAKGGGVLAVHPEDGRAAATAPRLASAGENRCFPMVYLRSGQNKVADRFRNGEEAAPSRGWRQRAPRPRQPRPRRRQFTTLLVLPGCTVLRCGGRGIVGAQCVFGVRQRHRMRHGCGIGDHRASRTTA
jgi:hypothetical protein